MGRAGGSWALVSGRWQERTGAQAAAERARGAPAGVGAAGRGRHGRAAWALGARPGRWARGLGAGRAAWALGARPGRLGARPGRLGWPWAVHSAHFRSVLTNFFSLSYQMNTVHCKVKFFGKK